jgi:hypothetical protein
LPACTNERFLSINTPRAWTPDGRGRAFIKPPGTNVWIAPIDGGPPQQLTHFDERIVTSLAFSPDGKRLALTRMVSLSDVVLLKGPK